MQTGALLLDGNTLNYFGKNIPINLVFAVIAEVVLLGGAEYYRLTNGLVCEDSVSTLFIISIWCHPFWIMVIHYILSLSKPLKSHLKPNATASFVPIYATIEKIFTTNLLDYLKHSFKKTV